MNRKELALHYFHNGYNCAQAVAAAFHDRTPHNEKTVLASAAGFGAGMGRMSLTCGAVTGAVITIGFMIGQTEPNDPSVKENCYLTVQDFFKRFTAVYGTTQCKDLLGCDMNTPEGLKTAKENNYHTTKCPKFIETAVEVLEEII